MGTPAESLRFHPPPGFASLDAPWHPARFPLSPPRTVRPPFQNGPHSGAAWFFRHTLQGIVPFSLLRPVARGRYSTQAGHCARNPASLRAGQMPPAHHSVVFNHFFPSMSSPTPDAPRAKKSLGQHFLRNEGICRRIAALLMPHADDRVLEIGPGPGALTRALEAQPHAALLLLEKDRHWAAERQRHGAPGTRAVLMDALRFDWRRLPPEAGWKITGNLPYNVGSPLIWDIVSQSGATRCVFMVQKEVGQRLAAAPGTRQYGALSVWVQAHTLPRLEFTLGPGAFSPPPKVDSAVLSFTPVPPGERPHSPLALARLLRLCFQQRRKQLGGIFTRAGLAWLAEALPDLGLSPQLRPETLSVGAFLRLSALLADKAADKMEGQPAPGTKTNV